MTIYRVQIEVQVSGAWTHQIVDLLLTDGPPIAVLEWDGERGKSDPLVSVALDSKQLREFQNGDATHLYDGHIVDPRPAQQTRH